MHPGSGLSFFQGPLQGLKRKLPIQPLGYRPPDYSSKITIQNGRQVHKASQNSDIGNIRHPNLIDGIFFQPLQEIGEHRQVVIRLSVWTVNFLLQKIGKKPYFLTTRRMRLSLILNPSRKK